MPLNKDLIGKEYPPTTTEATLDAMQNYARPITRTIRRSSITSARAA